MRKILNHVFQIFLCSQFTLYGSNISCITKKARFLMIGNGFITKRLKLISLKIKDPNHQCKGFLAWISNLIHSTYKPEPKPNQENKEVAPKLKEPICIFYTKTSNLFS